MYKSCVYVCKAFYLIYSYKLKKLNMEYVGQTYIPLHIRIILHISDINKTISNNIELSHFQLYAFNVIIIKILSIYKNLSE